MTLISYFNVSVPRELHLLIAKALKSIDELLAHVVHAWRTKELTAKDVNALKPLRWQQLLLAFFCA